MHHTRINLETALTTKELGQLFKNETQRMYGLGGKLGHGIRSMSSFRTTGFQYFRPTGDAFSTLDDDPPAFEVGVVIPTATYTNGGGITLHMYVWDRGDHREEQLVAPHGVINGAAKSRRRLNHRVRTRQAEPLFRCQL